MAQPTPYVPTADYSVDIVPGDLGNALDHDFDDIALTTDQILANLVLIQRDDGLLANGAVGIDQLAAETLDLLGNWNPRGAWVTATVYAKLDFVVQGGIGYLCGTAHTSGVFATDLAAGKWVPLSKVDSLASPFTLTLVDDVSAAAWLTTLGVSAFIQTLLDDANASAAQTTLGISTFIKTLLDDADQATARATLGTYSTAQVDAGDTATLAAASAAAILKTFVAAKGDLIGASANDTPLILSVGADGKILQADSSQATGLIWRDKSVIAGAATVTTSGTAFNFTGIPAWAKRLHITFRGVSLSGTDDILVQIGPSGGVETSAYISSSSASANAGVGVSTSTAGFVIRGAAGANLFSGKMTIDLHDAASNVWVSSHAGKITTLAGLSGGGDKALGGVLSQVTVTRSGTDTFDAGSVNVTYE